jgi:hypothetical protein
MNITGNLTAGVTITFTAAEREVIIRALKREIKRRQADGEEAQTGTVIFSNRLKTIIEVMVRDFLDMDRLAPLTQAEQDQIAGIFATAAERDVAGVPLTVGEDDAPKRARRKAKKT